MGVGCWEEEVLKALLVSAKPGILERVATVRRCHADCLIQLVPCERPFNLTVGTATHRCHADCSIQLVPCERPFNLTVGPRVTQNVRSNLFPVKDPSISLWGPPRTAVTQTVRSNLFPVKDPSISLWGPPRTAVTQTVRSNLFPVKDPSISLWGHVSRRMFDPTCSL